MGSHQVVTTAWVFCPCPGRPSVKSLAGSSAASETQEQSWLGITTGSGQFFRSKGGSVKNASHNLHGDPTLHLMGPRACDVSPYLPSAPCLVFVLAPK